MMCNKEPIFVTKNRLPDDVDEDDSSEKKYLLLLSKVLRFFSVFLVSFPVKAQTRGSRGLIMGTATEFFAAATAFLGGDTRKL